MLCLDCEAKKIAVTFKQRICWVYEAVTSTTQGEDQLMNLLFENLKLPFEIVLKRFQNN